MDTRELQGLLEAYNQIHAPQEVDEAVKGASPHTMQMRKDAAAERRAGIKPLPAKKGEEYAKYKMSQMAYSKRKREMDEDVEQIDEISQKTATRAYATSYTGEFEGQDSDRDVKRTDNLRRQIKRKFGDKAAQHADRAGHSMTFGRKGAGGMPSVKEEVEQVDEATAMAKRGLDEPAIRQKIAKSTGGGVAADRATKLADKPTFGNANKAQQRQNLARAQRSDFRKTTSSSPGLHGYGHKSDDPAVKAKQAARGAQRGALTPVEKKQLNREEFDIFDVVLEFLQAEGYAETLEQAEWMMANVIDEEAIDIILGEGHGSRTSFKKQSADERGRINMFKGSKIEYTPHKNYDPEANRGQGQILRPNQAEKQRRKKLAKSAMGEDYVNEAQHARENPEKYEREQEKKYAPVRGEKTPMPPRGDKRREDFEKWYAKQMGR